GWPEDENHHCQDSDTNGVPRYHVASARRWLEGIGREQAIEAVEAKAGRNSAAGTYAGNDTGTKRPPCRDLPRSISAPRAHGRQGDQQHGPSNQPVVPTRKCRPQGVSRNPPVMAKEAVAEAF